MPRQRWVTCSGRQWRLSELAHRHELAPGTLAYRIDHRGMTPERALATGIMSKRAIGLISKSRGPWA